MSPERCVKEGSERTSLVLLPSAWKPLDIDPQTMGFVPKMFQSLCNCSKVSVLDSRWSCAATQGFAARLSELTGL
jgi:hypothetical protein